MDSFSRRSRDDGGLFFAGTDHVAGKYRRDLRGLVVDETRLLKFKLPKTKNRKPVARLPVWKNFKSAQ